MAQTQYFLAVDIGASSGRHMLSHMEDGKIVLEEMYRFPNGNERHEGLQRGGKDPGLHGH